MNFPTLSGPRPSRRGRRGVVFTLALAVVSVGGGALAQEEPPRSVTVMVRDLDLQTPDGTARLMRRIEWAANTVCGDRFAIDLVQRQQFRACRRSAVSRAVHDVNAPTLSALAERTIRPITVTGG